MITLSDFQKKQIIFVFFNEGEKLAISNDNLVVKNSDGTVKLQCTCYRVFLVFAIGNFSITSVVIQRAKKFGFYIACMTSNFRLYDIVGAMKDGNTVLKAKQYSYSGNDIGAHIIKNKLINQEYVLGCIRHKSDSIKEAISCLKIYISKLDEKLSLNEIMAYEGLAAKIYFKNHFNNVLWNGRQPRLKRDYVNSALDIGYSILFSYVDAMTQCYGFDSYVGVLHRQFYMRKSLICDLVEPFRGIIDIQVKKGINLNQIKEDDFIYSNGQWSLKYESSAKYAKMFMLALIERKSQIFSYIHKYYISFMKGLSASEFPMFLLGEENDNN